MKRIFAVILTVILFAAAFSGCSAADKTYFDAYLLPGGAGPNIFKEGTPTLDTQNGVEEESPEPSKHKEVLFNDQLHDLALNDELSGEWNVYMSEAGNITCWFDVDTEKLRMISAEGWFDTAAADDMDQDDYVQWIKQMVAEYYTEDWSIYTLSCKTTVTDTYTGSPVQSSQKGFLTAYDEHETVTAYTFKFTKYIDEYATSDAIQAYIRMDTGFVALEFSGHSFDGITTVKVDKDKITRSLSRFIVNSVDSTEYAYQKYLVSDPKLAYVNGKLSYVCTTTIGVLSILREENDLENLEIVQQIILPLS